MDNIRPLPPSHFSFVEGSVIRETTNKKKAMDTDRAAGAEVITKALQKHGFLTRALIARSLMAHKHKTIDLVKSLRKMQQQGEVRKYTIETGTGDDLSVFCLSEGMRIEHPDKGVFRYDMTDIPYILSHLSTAQWEIAVQGSGGVWEHMYEGYTSVNGKALHIPSLIRFNYEPGKYMFLVALPSCRDRDPMALRSFLTHVNSIHRYLTDSYGKYRSVQIIIICESVRQIEDMCRLFSRISELAGIYFLYTTDAITADPSTPPLTMLYGADILDDGSVELSLYSLKKKTVREYAHMAVDTIRERGKELIENLKEGGIPV